MCTTCTAGSEPVPDQTSCAECATGLAGTGGECVQCVPGKTPVEDRTSCATCDVGKAGSDGTCSQCLDGEQANSALQPTSCVVCPSATAGTGGVCDECSAGMQPKGDLTVCEVCAAGYFSVAGVSCLACADGVVDGVSNGVHTPDLVT